MLGSSLRRRSGGNTEDGGDGDGDVDRQSLLSSKEEGKGTGRKNIVSLVAVTACLVLAYGFWSTDSVVKESAVLEEQETLNNLQQSNIDIATKPTTPDTPKTCGIWMAPGSLIPHPGFGIYTTRDIPQGGKFLYSEDAVSVQVLEPRRKENIPLATERRQWWKLFQNYAWDHGVPDHARYAHMFGDMTDFQPGFGSLPNHHCILNSLSSRSAVVPYDDTLVQRTSPGLGAFSYTIGRDWVSKRNVKAGEELFLSYGFCERTEEDNKWNWANKMFMPEDFREARRLIKLFKPFGDQEWPTNNVTLAKLMDTSSKADPKLVYQILPKTQQEIDHLESLVNQHALDSSAADKELLRELARGVTEQRTPEWIRQNGMCLENLVPKKSTLPDAGWGGFAQYKIEKDDIIVPMPTLHMTNKEVMKLYDNEKYVVDDPIKHEIGSNLFLNYCFGRPESSMVLCPLTSAILVNHCSTRQQNNGCEPNARVRWSSGWDAPSHEWRNATLSDLGKHSARVLSLELVATKTIAPGEEVFIDYGIEWEEAWNNHAKQWKAPPVQPNFLSAKEANLQTKIPDELISYKLRETVSHPYIFAGCVYRPGKVDESGTKYSTPNANWKNLTSQEIMERYADKGDKYHHGSSGYSKHSMMLHWPCSILHPDKDDGKYIVRIYQTPLGKRKIGKTLWFQNDLPRILYEYPREKAYTFS